MLKNNAAQAAQANAKLNKNNAAKAEQRDMCHSMSVSRQHALHTTASLHSLCSCRTSTQCTFAPHILQMCRNILAVATVPVVASASTPFTSALSMQQRRQRSPAPTPFTAAPLSALHMH
eukprot:scaffold32546_cov21-Tisochrysis_lutea.AAC.2